MDTKSSDQGSKAAPLIILPGLMCDSRMFAELLSAFPEAQVIDGFYAGCDRIEAMANYVLARMPARVSLLGHSMGARIALEVMRKAPDRVERLALVDTGVHGPKPGERDARYALRDLGREQGMAALVANWLPPMMGFAGLRNEPLMDSLYAMAVSAGLATFEAQIEALLNRPSVDAQLPTIACPTVAMVGRQDQWSPVAQHEAIVAAIPGAQLRIVEGAGHMMPAEAPQVFNQLVGEWLAIAPAP
ncbi:MULTISPECIES: alpha/beta fold hydrolase [unclassified Sphingobium]|uniref:alpha/beta fold hydrolase n=1 Tax=unclassified Sphingobium TaxID=2611147 RepID=UPI000D16AB69|nr:MULTISPECIES: alpha/beta hydrolase [unclassified Sphingobium]MBG6120379.1 pimeloyl-ACP methyl ester carboxylesterase [Sphingobium sp. JAI105]PSO11104.1 alpha/beta hydrolase [Sphingobium sp. AEW4]TWD05614.1 pimeloyl-ACP methyl ester carboxylesterase [Sphingobium sp. AEW010]TWD22499.1 pimeloyl-ACP methyl ester carboxylesterase [Sphingobium sp. AEW013]TWD24958.1 pimeloyl-ACP methyl ester carboxylesterase [Sphingobium sp. AEW001]